jgi:hypothetical protein
MSGCLDETKQRKALQSSGPELDWIVVVRHDVTLPDRRREKDEPIVMASRRQEQDEECNEAQRLEGKADELP